MGGRKRQIKDPIYGYINLPDGIVQSIVDTPEFQRLRKITQTSYEALYPSATHNRFAHSLGVFHLGSLVAKAIEDESLGGYELNDFHARSDGKTLVAPMPGLNMLWGGPDYVYDTWMRQLANNGYAEVFNTHVEWFVILE